ncbi:MAG: hypothetical protein WCJ13_08425 [Coriobacteriia bacterium]
MLDRLRLRRPHNTLGLVLAATALLAVVGCSLPPALAKAELDANKLPEKHPPVSVQKAKDGCRSCHREQQAAKVAK